MAEVPATRPPLSGGQSSKSIRTLLENPQTVAKFQQLVPKHLSPERLLRTMALAVHKTPKLAECEPITLLGAMMACASLGFEPNTVLGHAYLIPFEKKKKVGNEWKVVSVDVNLIIGYRGYIDLARRSGEMRSIHADVVYGKGTAKGADPDIFEFEYGTSMHLKHIPQGDREGRPPTYAYAVAALSDGTAFEVLPYSRVLVIRNNSEGYKAAVAAKARAEREQDIGRKKMHMRTYESSPWVAYEHEMAAKTMIRRLAKMLPMSIEFANAKALDEMSEAGRVDFSQLAEGIDLTIDDASGAIIDQDGVIQDESEPEATKDPVTTQQPTTTEAPKDDEPSRTRAARKTAATPDPTTSKTPSASTSQPSRRAAFPDE